jgi:putative endonuclease
MLRRLFGNKGERAAERFLKRSGLRILARQYETRWGEIDLIALEKQTVVFVEVKTRSSSSGGRPAERIDAKKQKNMTKSALYYLKQKGLLENPTRFDVVEVIWQPSESKPVIEHQAHAFEAVDLGNLF